MKKKLRKSSYRKAVINGLLVFGGIALLTTGFATWVIGANNSTDDIGDTNVTVDTAKRNNITLTVELSEDDNTIHIGENKTAGSGNFIQVTEDDDSDYFFGPTDFEVTLDITLTVGEDVEEKPNKIKFDFNYTDTGNGEDRVTSKNKIKPSSDTNIHKIADGELNFLDISASSTLDISSFSTSSSNGSTIYESKGKTVTLFEWGNYFDKKSPSQFYNDLYDGAYNSEELAENIYYQRKVSNNSVDVNAVYNELDYLKTTFNEKTIVVTASAVYESADLGE